MTIMAETITPERLDTLLTDESIPLAHRALWRLLWESDIRILDLLSLTVAEVDPDSRQIVRPGPGFPVALSERATGLLTPLLDGRSGGPLFLAGQQRRALSWEEAVRTAKSHGHAIHAFRTGGKQHRRHSA
ncbi:hypothetical protein [Streptomyces profundus]|uniref:hypothetical protein n=1 Tax=Streptomyces profundus TaxID=2867410 RepID=UPI001D167C1B|nr:hypothetical protein [Streptomyces sp. MA3_2.13]UED86178.1 hypothetical protein K4G22_19930 [Streptomyces sp. MA3_2.13]